MKSRNLFFLLALSSSLFAPGLVMSAEKAELVSMEMINSKGYSATLSDGLKVRVVKIQNREAPQKQCRLDVSSLKRMTADKWARAGHGAVAQLSLKARSDSEGVYCAGKGSGCLITVEIPDAKAVADRLSN